MQSSNDCMLKSFSFSYLDGETSLCMLIRKLFWKVWNIYKLMIQSILAGVIFVSLLVHQINSKSPLQIISSQENIIMSFFLPCFEYTEWLCASY